MQVDDSDIYRIAAGIINKQIEDSLFGATTATGNTIENSLSTNDQQGYYDLLDSLLTPVYYAMSEYLEVGKVIQVAKGKYHPEYIAFNPVDLDTIKSKLPGGCKLVPLSEAPLLKVTLGYHSLWAR